MTRHHTRRRQHAKIIDANVTREPPRKHRHHEHQDLKSHWVHLHITGFAYAFNYNFGIGQPQPLLSPEQPQQIIGPFLGSPSSGVTSGSEYGTPRFSSSFEKSQADRLATKTTEPTQIFKIGEPSALTFASPDQEPNAACSNFFMVSTVAETARSQD